MGFYANLTRDDYLIVTFNGENYRGGFDFPFLRTKFAFYDLPWIFNGFQHLDLYPLIKKRFNNDAYEIKVPSKSKLNKADLVKLAKANGLEYKTKKETYKDLQNISEPEWLDYPKEKLIKSYDEQSIYQTFFDPDKKEEYIDGSEVPELYEKGKKEKIISHCKRDVRRLYEETDLLLSYIPDWEIQRNINYL